MQKVMIIEDDKQCIKQLKKIIQSDEFEVVSITSNSQESIRIYKHLKPHLVLIDIILKGNESGIEIAQKLKAINPKLKIIFLTAYSTDEMIELAVKLKAYGYIIKPVQPDEIIATIKLAILHKDIEKPKRDYREIQLKKGYSFNTLNATLTYHGKEVSLTKHEKELFMLLTKNINYSVSTEQISYYIWGELKEISTVRSLIHRIRHKLKNNIILNSNGYGYTVQG
jgi:DNA-binding response OmpR family regulator